MTRSLPGTSNQQLKTGGWANRLQSVATSVGAKVIPWVPTRAVRLLAGGPFGHDRREHAGSDVAS